MSASAQALGDEKGTRDLVKDLADAVSTQADVANRTWLALISVAVVALIPHAKGVSLPFSLGEVPQSWFHGVVFAFLVVLAIAFASAHSQQVRAQKLAQLVIGSLGSILGPVCAIHPRDYFDMQRKASLIHIASLAQSLRGKYQFYTTATGLPIWQKKNNSLPLRTLEDSRVRYLLLVSYSSSLAGTPRFLSIWSAAAVQCLFHVGCYTCARTSIAP